MASIYDEDRRVTDPDNSARYPRNIQVPDPLRPGEFMDIYGNRDAPTTGASSPGGITPPKQDPNVPVPMNGQGPPVTPPPTGSGASLPDWLKRLIPGNGGGAETAALMTLLTMLMQRGGGGQLNDPALTNEMRQGMEMQRKRLEQTQPVFDTLVNMSYGSTPTRYRGAAQPGFTQAPVEGPYRYEGPKFGGQG